MKDEKALQSGNFVEAGRADLVGDHVGATASLVKKNLRRYRAAFSLSMKPIPFAIIMKMVSEMRQLIPLLKKWKTTGMM